MIDKEKERKRIGQRIADLRKEKGLTQLDIANKTGIQRCHVARIEAGRYSVGLDTLAMIGDAMDMDIDYVERGDEYPAFLFECIKDLAHGGVYVYVCLFICKYM